MPKPMPCLQIAPLLQLLTGMPSSVIGLQLQQFQGDRWGRLQALHLHAPSSLPDVWVGGALWQPLTALAQLAVTASCYTTLTVEELPRTLRQVSATAHAIYCDVPILLGCPEVDLVARELYLIANTPQNNEESSAFIWPLPHLARTLAAAGPTRGHTAWLCTQVGPAADARGWVEEVGASRSRPACRAAAAACCSTHSQASFKAL
jgi:hypothetical protein